MSFFLSSKAPYRFRAKYARLSLKMVSAICFVGTAPFMIQLANGLMQTIINNSLALYGGDAAVSAMGATIAVTVLLFMPVIGLCEGSQPVVSFNLGARNYGRVLKVYRTNIAVSTLFFIVSCAILQLFAPQIIRVFNKGDADLIRIGTHSLKIIGAMYPLVGLSVATTFFLQAVRSPRMAAFLALSRQLLFVIPGIVLLGRRIGLNGVFYAFPLADALGFLVAIPVTVHLFRKFGAMHRSQQQEISR